MCLDKADLNGRLGLKFKKIKKHFLISSWYAVFTLLVLNLERNF